MTQTSHTRDGWGAQRSTTEHEQERAKLAAHELAQLGDGDGVLIHGRDLPARVRLPFWWIAEGARTPEEAHRREFERQRSEREERSR